VAASALWIPDPYRRALLVLAQLEADEAEKLIEGFRSTEPFRRVADLRAVAHAALPPQHNPQAARLVQALLSLAGQLRDSSADEVADAVSRSPDFDFSPEEQAKLRSRLQLLVQAAAITTTARALELLTENDRNYQTARVITDLRPVFGPDVEQRPPGAVIVEMLQLHTWGRNGDPETIYVAMDEADLQELQGVVERALKKTKTLKQHLEEREMYYFELDKRDV